MRSLSLPLLPNAYTVSYPPTAPDKTPEPIQYFPLPDILTRAWTTDAHTTAYSVQSLSFRLSKAAITLESGVVMVVFIADIDCAQSHAASGGQGDVPAPDDWWLAELDKIERLRDAFPGAFVYRTRGGYRLVYLLACPHILRSPADVDAWKADYLAWIAALACYASPSTVTPAATIGNGSIGCPMRPGSGGRPGKPRDRRQSLSDRRLDL